MSVTRLCSFRGVSVLLLLLLVQEHIRRCSTSLFTCEPILPSDDTVANEDGLDSNDKGLLLCTFQLSATDQDVNRKTTLRTCSETHCVQASIEIERLNGGAKLDPSSGHSSSDAEYLFERAAIQSHKASHLYSGSDSADSSIIPDDVRTAIGLYMEELQIYDQIETHFDQASYSMARLQFSRAVAFLNLGQASAEITADESSAASSSLSTTMEYFRQAQKLFIKLDSGSQPSKTDPFLEEIKEEIQLQLAVVNIYIANTLISSNSLENTEVHDIIGENQEQLLSDPVKVEALIKEALTPVIETNIHARTLLNDSIERLKKLESNSASASSLGTAKTSTGYQDFGDIVKSRLATAYQSLSSVVITLGDPSTSLVHLNSALAINKDLLQKHSADAIEPLNIITMIADILYSRSDISLQLEKYDDAITQYREAMTWYIRYNLSPPPVHDVGDTLDGTLLEFENALDEYNEMFGEGVDSTDGGVYMEEMGDQEAYLRDNGYEGDIHSSLGALYLAKGDIIEAKSHLYQAINLYALQGEQLDHSMAGAKLQYASALFQAGEYEESIEFYEQAVSIYKENGGSDLGQYDGSLTRIAAELTEAIQQTQSQQEHASSQKSATDHENPIYDLDQFLDSLTNITGDEIEGSDTGRDEL